MTAYFQMGHDTDNLIGEKDLSEYGGIILSPMNRKPDQLKKSVLSARNRGSFDIILDPQMYFPRSDKGSLQDHPYYPSDLDTADLSSENWWSNIIDRLVSYSSELELDAIASPVTFPKVWNDDYYALCVFVSNLLASKTNLRSLMTVTVNLAQIQDENSALRIASLITNTKCLGYYIVLVSETDPRRELSDEKELFGVMVLIHALVKYGRTVIISHCSSDMLLFKAAGATHCATGKFFNLRRFTKSRYEEPSGGGGQLPYWFEHALLAFLRESDVLRLQSEGKGNLLGTLYSSNIWSQLILSNLRSQSGNPWVGSGWRQYLSWFGKTESFLEKGNALELVKQWLSTAETNWGDLEDEEVLFEEPKNNGFWIRPWRQALVRFSKLIQ